MKVLKNGKESKCGIVECSNCNSELYYEESDIELKYMAYGHDFEGKEEYETCECIVCPICGHTKCLGIV